MRVFSYIVSKDFGYAPNPFHGVCTLACCKPAVRRSAQPGDLIFGLTTKERGSRLVYGMLVTERLTFEQYWHDPRFRSKQPDMTSAKGVDRRGDNHYEPVGDHVFRQHPSRHSNPDGSVNEKQMSIDLGPDRRNPVLVGERFCYFGQEAIQLPSELRFLVVGRAHRCIFTSEQIRLAVEAFEGLPQGILSFPSRWTVGDESWQSHRTTSQALGRILGSTMGRSPRDGGHCG